MDLYKNKTLINKSGKFYKIETVGIDMIGLKSVETDNYTFYVSKQELDDYYEIDLNDKFVLNKFTNITNRSIGQTQFLIELLKNDYNKLIEVEEKIKNNNLHYCPSTIEEVQEILDMDINDKWFDLSLFKN